MVCFPFVKPRFLKDREFEGHCSPKNWKVRERQRESSLNLLTVFLLLAAYYAGSRMCASAFTEKRLTYRFLLLIADVIENGSMVCTRCWQKWCEFTSKIGHLWKFVLIKSMTGVTNRCSERNFRGPDMGSYDPHDTPLDPPMPDDNMDSSFWVIIGWFL